jgi:hypothetical protein
VAVDLFTDKSYDTANVISNVISRIASYFDVGTHDMGEDIFVGDLEKEINTLDGVISIISLRIYSIRGGSGGYSTDKCPLPTVIEGSACDVASDTTFEIGGGSFVDQLDLNETDKVLYSDYNSMYEIKSPKSDIQIRCKSV